MSLSAGTRLGPYEILSALGAGGMGEVYRAQDTRLDRTVAIKVLPAQFAAEPDRMRRFEEEARAIASLNHPHICQIYDIGPGYLVLEYIDGTPPQGPLTPDEAVRLGLQIVSALEAAHQRRILHRDLKPANILVTPKGNVKLLDFGLAKLMAVDGDVTRTMEGTVLGTPAYMSPEQAQGRTLDERSDVFSFGAVLYEMLSGRRAFRGDTPFVTVTAVVNEEPPPLETPAALERIVSRCLAKQPRERFQAMAEVKAALEQAVVKPTDQQPSIAVLPFANMSRDPDDEYFSDGLAEEIINALTHVPGLNVTARTSAFAFRGKEQDIRKIGEALDVRTILEGSVRRAGSRIRVTAQLINAGNGYHLWSERYDRELTDVFAIQDEIVESIVRALRIRLGRSEVPVAARRHSTNVAAYQDYLRGLNHWYRRDADSIQRAAHFFEQAVQRDPNYALAHAGVAESYASLGWYGFRPDEARTKSRAALSRALALDDTLAEVHAAAGLCKLWLEWDWPETERALRTAIELEPSHTRAKCWFAFLRMVQGRFSEACTFAREAQALEPVSPYVSAILVHALMLDGPHTEALTEVERGRDLAPDSLHLLWSSGAAYVRAGLPDEAVAVLERAAMLTNRDTYYLGWLGWAYAVANLREPAESTLDELQARARTAYVSPVFRAWILGALGRIDEAFDLLEQGYQERSPLLPWLVYPVYDPMRNDARFNDLSRRMKLA